MWGVLLGFLIGIPAVIALVYILTHQGQEGHATAKREWQRCDGRLRSLDILGAGLRIRPREGATSDFGYVNATFAREVVPELLTLAQALDAMHDGR